MGIQESRLASNDFKKAAERVRERWALGESKPVGSMHSFAALRWLYYSISRNTTAHTHIHTLRVAHCWTQLRVSGLARVAGAQPEKRIANFGMVTCGFGFGVGGREAAPLPARVDPHRRAPRTDQHRAG